MTWHVDDLTLGEIAVLEARGDVDMATAPLLHTRILDLLAGGWNMVVVDLKDVSFIDSSGLGVLLSAHRRLRAAGGGLAVVAASMTVWRIFEVTGLTRVLTVSETSAAAAEGLRREA